MEPFKTDCYQRKLFLLLLLTLGLGSGRLQAQTEYAWETFKDTRIINGHSVETGNAGEMKFVISHRFGALNGGGYELFGLDQSNIRFGLDYSLNNNISFGLGRSSFQKTYDGFVKVQFLWQRKGERNFPFSATWYSNAGLKGLRPADPAQAPLFTSRLSFAHQLLIARKFSDRLSLQLMPTLVHRNIVPDATERNDVLAIGAGGRIQMTKVVALMFEYYHVLPGQIPSNRQNSLSIGVDIKTKSHVFQLHVSNSQGMVEQFYITETRDRWQDMGIHLGFNITRDFKIRGRRYE